jgi:transcription antitermination factor NusG
MNAAEQVAIDVGERSVHTMPAAGVAVDAADQNWYAIYLCVRHEKRVAQRLCERNIRCFLPTYRSVRRWKDRRKELEMPVFPGYLFVCMDLRDKLQVLQQPGVIRFIGFNGQPSRLSQSDLDIVSNAMSRGVHLEPHPYLKIGRKVTIRRGPLAGLQGILVKKKDNFRLVLSIDLIKRSAAVEVDGADVEES